MLSDLLQRAPTAVMVTLVCVLPGASKPCAQRRIVDGRRMLGSIA